MSTATMTRFPPAQLQVIRQAALGVPNRQMAVDLDLPWPTVMNRLRTAMLTTGTGTRAGLVAQACRWGQLRDLPVQNPGPVVLTPPLVRVLGLLAAGMQYREIAAVTGLSKAGVADRSLRLVRALGASDRAHAVLIAWQMRILPEVAR